MAMPTEQQQGSTSATGYSQWFILITAVFITCLVTANITAVKLVSVFGLVVPAAIIILGYEGEIQLGSRMNLEMA
ncbi:MAG: hypothetical protein H8D78_19125, partial [Chloroflexi bacterium]|nr:hypothetical protein [Chloroflexota bacterium]